MIANVLKLADIRTGAISTKVPVCGSKWKRFKNGLTTFMYCEERWITNNKRVLDETLKYPN